MMGIHVSKACLLCSRNKKHKLQHSILRSKFINLLVLNLSFVNIVLAGCINNDGHTCI